MINWRSLFDDINVEYRDRGKNASRGNINISCPFCGDDPSFHLSVSEGKEAYYCYREPNSHSGTSTNRLLIALGISVGDIPLALNRYNSETPFTPAAKKSATISITSWQKFESAADSPRCVDYLRERGFAYPVATCRQYDLRYSREGKWAQRLLLPIRDFNGKVVSWTGRALKSDMDPKYRMETNDLRDHIYVPRSIQSTLVIVEGPLDALKICASCPYRNVSSMGLLGKGVSNEKYERIASQAISCNQIFVAFDADVSAVETYNFIYELSSRVPCPVNMLEVPYGYKDAAELESSEIDAWIPGE